IERRERLIRDEHARARERVHERRLAGVRVADERREIEALAAARLPAALALLRDLVKTLLQIEQAALDDATIGLEERFTGTAGADATTEARQSFPDAPKTRPQVLELRELDLHAA